jgi:hypothetical protein
MACPLLVAVPSPSLRLKASVSYVVRICQLLGNGRVFREVRPESNEKRVELRVKLRSVNQRATGAEESPSLRFVTRKRLVKTLQMNSHFGELLPRQWKLRRLSLE